jgi:hypothetical protein
MTANEILLELINGYKTYVSATLMVVAGIGSVVAKHFNPDVADIFQMFAVLFAGLAVASLRHGITKVPDGVLDAARRSD